MVTDSFTMGSSHLAIVCEDRPSANNLRDFCDILHLNLSRSKSDKELKAEDQHDINHLHESIIGLITLEDVVDEVLKITIRDEKDYDQKRKEEV